MSRGEKERENMAACAVNLLVAVWQMAGRHCFLCKTNLQIHGCATVPLFKPTKKKEFIEKSFCKANSIVLSQLLKSIGIIIDHFEATLPSVCTKCARKIVNCIASYHELQDGFGNSSGGNSEESSTDGGIKRFHGNSPSGLTPSKKKSCTPQPVRPKSRKTFELNSAWKEKENIDDAIANLMCLPVTTNESPSSTVKVGNTLSYFFEGDFAEMLTFKNASQH